jgi:copper resistance protein B
MKTFLRTVVLIILIYLPGTAIATAQTPTPPTPSSPPAETPMKMPMPTPSPTPASSPAQTRQNTSGGQQQPTPNLYPPPKDWPSPVDDEMKHTFVLADVLEFRPKGDESDFRWDIEGYRGGDFNRLWFKTEGEQNATRAERNIDFQLLYGRFIKRYYDLQIGGRAETRTFRGASVTRGQAVIGIEGLVPYRYEIEALLFISHQGDVSGRLTLTRDFLMTQRWVLQARFETNIAAQRVERFGVGRGLNDIEPGLRLRYEIRRKFAPYVGITYDQSLFGTADLVRRDGGEPRKLRFVAGVRVWH